MNVIALAYMTKYQTKSDLKCPHLMEANNLHIQKVLYNVIYMKQYHEILKNQNIQKILFGFLLYIHSTFLKKSLKWRNIMNTFIQLEQYKFIKSNSKDL